MWDSVGEAEAQPRLKPIHSPMTIIICNSVSKKGCALEVQSGKTIGPPKLETHHQYSPQTAVRMWRDTKPETGGFWFLIVFLFFLPEGPFPVSCDVPTCGRRPGTRCLFHHLLPLPQSSLFDFFPVYGHALSLSASVVLDVRLPS